MNLTKFVLVMIKYHEYASKNVFSYLSIKIEKLAVGNPFLKELKKGQTF